MNIHVGGFILSKRKGKGNIRVAVERRSTGERRSGPTPERLAKAGDDAIRSVGSDGERIVVMRDAPLDRMYSRHAIDPVEYQALQKLKWHWHSSGMPGAIRSADLNRVFAADHGLNMTQLAGQEAQAHHRQQWRKAEATLSPRARIVVERVVCREQTIEHAGYAIGMTSKHRANAAASELLRDAGYRLATLWGMH